MHAARQVARQVSWQVTDRVADGEAAGEANAGAITWESSGEVLSAHPSA